MNSTVTRWVRKFGRIDSRLPKHTFHAVSGTGDRRDEGDVTFTFVLWHRELSGVW
jgi:hypothetical protein